MARGNWRSGKGHGPAERGSSNRKIIDGWMMKPVGRFDSFIQAAPLIKSLEKDGYVTAATCKGKGHKVVVYRTLRRGQKRMKEW